MTGRSLPKLPLLSALLLGLACSNADEPVGVDFDEDGYTDTDGDCDDHNASVHPDAPELCDGRDNDCVGGANRTGETTDADLDGVLACADCDDRDGTLGNVLYDQDCDGITAFDDCDDRDATKGLLTEDVDCDGLLDLIDCDAADPESTSVYEDADCDGVPTAEDCHDEDTGLRRIVGDEDCDGVRGELDCDNADPSLGPRTLDVDCDGLVHDVDCDDNDPSIGLGFAWAEGISCGWDSDGDGWGDPDPPPPWNPGTDCEPLNPAVYPTAPEPMHLFYDDLNCELAYPSIQALPVVLTGNMLDEQDWTYLAARGGHLTNVGEVFGDGTEQIAVTHHTSSEDDAPTQISLFSSSDLTTMSDITDAPVTIGPDPVLGEQPIASFAAGDVDGDGQDDVWITTLPDALDTLPAVYLFLGASLATPGERTLSDADLIVWEDDVFYAQHLGWAITALPDLDGDGLDEAAFATTTGVGVGGRVSVVFGASLAGQTTFDLAFSDVQLDAEVSPVFRPSSLTTVDDYDGDGLSELVIAAEAHEVGGLANTGSVRLVHSTTLLSGAQVDLSAPDLELVGTLTDHRFGAQVVPLGDLDGDGLGDLAIGASTDASVGSSPPVDGTFVLHGTTLQGLSPGTHVGPSVADVGFLTDGNGWIGDTLVPADLYGDGTADLLIGEPTHTFQLNQYSHFHVAFTDQLTSPFSGVPTYAANGISLAGRSTTSADLDGDGDDEVIATHPGTTAPGGLWIIWADLP